MRVLLILFLFSNLANSLAATPNKVRATSRTVNDIREMLQSLGGCNANICFALDGSGSITEEDYDLQKNFVLDVVSAISGNPVQVAAVQYGRTATPISTLTSDISSFFLDVDASEPNGNRRTSISSGIFWCYRQLLKVKGEAIKMVIMGDGRNNAGGGHIGLARRFRRRTGGKVCAVGVGYKKIRKLRKITGNPNLVLTVDDYLELTDELQDLVMMVCGFDLL